MFMHCCSQALDKRILEAAAISTQRGLAKITLLGDKDVSVVCCYNRVWGRGVQ